MRREKFCLWFYVAAAQHLLQIHYQHIFTGKIPLAVKRRLPWCWRQQRCTLSLVAHAVVGRTITLAASQMALDQILSKWEYAACRGGRRGASGISELCHYPLLVTPQESWRFRNNWLGLPVTPSFPGLHQIVTSEFSSSWLTCFTFSGVKFSQGTVLSVWKHEFNHSLSTDLLRILGNYRLLD